LAASRLTVVSPTGAGRPECEIVTADHDDTVDGLGGDFDPVLRGGTTSAQSRKVAMASRRHHSPPKLGEFLDTLETRLRLLGPERVVAALIAHAGRLSAHSRQGLLDIFPEPGATPTADPRPAHRRLLTDIDAFAERARTGAFDAAEEYDDYWDDSDIDASWIEEADALFAAAADAFLADGLDLAREAYGRLLHLFGPIHHGGSDLDAWRLETTDIDEAAARYLRCVYDTTPTHQRAEAVYREYARLGLNLRRLRLCDLAGARRGDLSGLQDFLPAWIDALLTGEDRSAPEHRQQLLTEATLLHRGIDGLAELARRPGAHQPATYLDWIDALADADLVDRAAEAAREAMDLATTDTGSLARTADRLADLETRLDDPTEALGARRHAWRAEPTCLRLRALAAAGEAAGDLEQTLAAEAQEVRTATDRLSCELLLLGGQVDAAAAALAEAPPLGWSHPTHPGPVVLPYLLVAATATAPPSAGDTRLGRAFADIDADDRSPILQYQDLDDDVDGSDRGQGPPPPLLTTLLTRQITTIVASEAARRRWLATAVGAIDRRVEAIVGNKHRRAYARAATVVVGC
jgi:hypothetical protein